MVGLTESPFKPWHTIGLALSRRTASDPQKEAEEKTETMNASFIKFPSTPHLGWPGVRRARSDKVLGGTETAEFLAQPVVVEEKVDGANVGIAFDSNGNMIVQNRGSVLAPGGGGQFALLWKWLATREGRLFDVLEDRFILFGEWCFARHSIHYTRLPDYFLAFDIFDKHAGKFLNSMRRDRIAAELAVTTVPRIAAGLLTMANVTTLIGSSSLYDGPMEGVYLRQEGDCWLHNRAKIVRAEFVQNIEEHWSKSALVANQLARDQTRGAGLHRGAGRAG